MGVLKNNWPPRVLGYSWLYFIGSIVHTTFVTNTLTMPALFWAEKFHFFTFAALAFQSAYFYIIYMERDKLSEKISSNRFSRLIAQHPPLAVLLPIFVGAALFLSFNFEKVFLTTLWVGLIFIYFSIGLLIRSHKTVQIGIAALALCSARLIFFDLVQTNLSARALAFICVGALMLLISAVYKKYKHRVLIHE